MPEIYRLPGITLQQTKATRRTIVGVATSTSVVIGSFPKGPVFTPTRVQSIQECDRVFGGPKKNNLCSLVIHQFFANGGKDLWVISTGLKGARNGAFLLKGLSHVSKLESSNILFLPETFHLPAQKAVKVISTAISIAEKSRAMYFLDLPQAVFARRRVKDVVTWGRSQSVLQHQNVALYFPFIKLRSLITPSEDITIPVSGTIAGLYARIDAARGVWKAPAGTEATLKGIVGLDSLLSKKDLGLLASVNMNPLTQHSSLGYLAWGARTFSARSEWKYVPVRRTALFLEESIQKGLEWIVFEPNDEPLWVKIRQSIAQFLQSLYRRGAFQGAKSKDAYFVKCGRDTMTATDQAAGRVNIVVGFAPLKPAEFVVLKIQQRARSLS